MNKKKSCINSIPIQRVNDTFVQYIEECMCCVFERLPIHTHLLINYFIFHFYFNVSAQIDITLVEFSRQRKKIRLTENNSEQNTLENIQHPVHIEL